VDDRRKRLLYRATHRGTKEADAIFGGFITRHVADMTDAQVAEAEALLEESDIELVNWVFGREPAPDRWRSGLLAQIIAAFNGVGT
jgi:antitoxin CptB